MSKNKTAFITGITGQDGSWLAKHLLELGYDVFGGVRRISSNNFGKLKFLGIYEKVKLMEFDLFDYSNILQIIKDIRPDEFYNLAAQSFVGTSFKQPISTSQIDGMGVIFILDILHSISPETKFYQASTSELFGKVQQIPQNESTPFYPRSPYGVAKLFAHWMTINYRESYNMFASCGILFNHESELRGHEFVTRKISLNAAARKNGGNNILELGNMDSKRDWGYAKEYVEGMHSMLQQESSDTFVLATGITTTTRDFVDMCYQTVGFEIIWEGKNENEIGRDKKTGEILVKVNPEYYRPAEVELLVGDPSKAKNILGWEAKTTVSQLAELMVKSDLINSDKI